MCKSFRSLLLLIPCISKTVLSLSTIGRISHTRSAESANNSKHRLFGIQIEQVEQDIESNKEQLSSLSSSSEVKQPTSNGKNTKQRSSETLRFGGTQNYTSRIMPLPSNQQALLDFFSNVDNQVILLTGGKEDSTVTPIRLNPTTTEDAHLIDLWKTNAKFMGAEEPNEETDQVMKVLPSGIRIVTVEICPETIIGTKLTTTCCEQGEISEGDGDSSRLLPEFQAVLIEDDPKAIGPKPLVWLFNKIVYGGNPEGNNERTKDLEEKKRNRDEKALLRVWAERALSSEDGRFLTEPSFVFKAESEMQLEFEFPRWLLKFFPLSKSKAEAVCSAAITRELTANLKPAIDQFSKAYMKETHDREDIVVDER